MRQPAYLDSGAGRQSDTEIFHPNIHMLEECIDVGGEGLGADEILQRRAGRRQRRLQILADLPDLGAHVADSDHLAGGTFFFDLGDDQEKENFERKFKDPEGIIFDISRKGWSAPRTTASDGIARECMLAYSARDHAAAFKWKKFEKRGRYFHPLLATLITGGARLMLALAERQVLNQGLDWALCDTDSIAIANVEMLPPEEFKSRALTARDWFTDLNPYAEKGPILQLEKVDFPIDHDGELDYLVPPQFLALSAKRYVLFNHDDTGKPIIRKASGHGLGHLLEPYDEPPDLRRERIKRIGVPLWQEDFWREIIRAAESGNPDTVAFDTLSNFDVPAASRYAATTTSLLDWFKAYNAGKPYADQVKPFNFMLSLQSKSRIEMAATDMTALRDPLWKLRTPRPAAPYFKNPIKAGEHAFDREQPNSRIPVSWLKSHGRSLIRYHLHSERKFLDGEDDQRGTLRRRHVYALAFQLIGKEADNFEEREFIGDDEDDVIEHPLAGNNLSKLRTFVLSTQKKFGISNRDLCKQVHVSHHTIKMLRARQRISDGSLFNLVRAIELIRRVGETMTEPSRQ